MPHVVSICYSPAAGRPPDRFAREELAEAVLEESHGIAGDAKGGPGKRQVNVMFAEVLDRLRAEGFRTAPGELGEQIVVAGIDPAAAAPGTRLAVGGAVIEVTLPRTGCDRFAHIQGKPKASVAGRLGVLARVVAGGVVRPGDAVSVLG